MMFFAAGAFKPVPLPVVNVTGLEVSDYVIDPTDALAELIFERAGTLSYNGNGYSGQTEWISNGNSTIGDLYEIYFQVTGGFTPTGSAMNTWLALSSAQTVTLERTTLGSRTSTLDLQVRLASTGVVVATGTLLMSAVVDT